MWKTVTNIINESVLAFNALMGAPDISRELKRKINSAERFINWGEEAKNPLDFKEALTIIEQAPAKSLSAQEKLQLFHLKTLAYIGIIECKESDMERFNERIKKKYDTDEYMDQIINGIEKKMKELQSIITYSETGEIDKLRLILGEKKVLEIRPEEIILDTKKEMESAEENFIIKKSIKENKLSEINNFKNNLVKDITEIQEQVFSTLIEMDKLDPHFSQIEIEKKNQIKDEINISLQTTVNKLNNAGIPLKGNKGKK